MAPKGVVTTLSYMMPKLGMLDSEAYTADMTLPLLEKTVVDKNVVLSDLYAVDIITNNQFSDEGTKAEPKARQLILAGGGDNSGVTNQNKSYDDEGTDVNSEIKKLKAINNKLYEAAVKAILKE